jgi:hypothetical protein
VDEEPLPPGLPIPSKSTAPYVARLVAQALPVERASLVLDKAGMCPFCSKCRDDVPAPGEIVITEVVHADCLHHHVCMLMTCRRQVRLSSRTSCMLIASLVMCAC